MLHRLLILTALLLGFALAQNSSPNSPISSAVQIVETLADPTKYVEYFPDTDRWVPWFGRKIREYKVPIILYNFGLLLLLLGLAILSYQVYIGRRAGVEVLIRLILVAVLWQLMVLKPSQNGCTRATENNYPCQIEAVERKVTKPILISSGDGYTVINKDLYIQDFKANELSTHLAIKKLYKDVMLAMANQAIIASLKNEGEGVKKTQQTILNLSMVAWMAGGTASVSRDTPILARCLVGGVINTALKGLQNESLPQGCIVGAAIPEIAQGVANTMLAARNLLIVAPMMVIAAFHLINTLAGIYLYSMLFLMPLILPLVLMAGTHILTKAIQYMLVALLTPLISGVLLATGMSLSYSYGSNKMQEMETLANQLQELNISPGAAAFAVYGTEIFTHQLKNLYICLSANEQNLGTDEVSCSKNSDNLKIEEYKTLNGENPGASSEEINGKAWWQAVLKVTPFISGKPWDQSNEQKSLLGRLKEVFETGEATQLSQDPHTLLEIAKDFKITPDLGSDELSTAYWISIGKGLDKSAALQVRKDLDAIAFNPKQLPKNSVLQRGDTWASGSYIISILNRIVAAEASTTEINTLAQSLLKNKALNLILLTVVAMGITMSLLLASVQLLGTLFGSIVSVSPPASASALGNVQPRTGGAERILSSTSPTSSHSSSSKQVSTVQSAPASTPKLPQLPPPRSSDRR